MILLLVNITLKKIAKNIVSVSLSCEEAIKEQKLLTLFSLTLNKATTCENFIRNLK